VIGAAIFTLFVSAVPARAETMTRSPAQIRHDRALIWRVSRSVFGPHARVAFCIAGRETGGTYWPGAVSGGGGNFGEWQINRDTWDPVRNPRSPFSSATWSRVLDPWTNARMAFHISRGGTDWHGWTTHGGCGV
jgi:Lysozyme like domain